MKYSYAAEVDIQVAKRVIAIANRVGDILDRELAKPQFEAMPVDLGYVPIVMAEDSLETYKARTKVRLTKRLLDSAPQLPFDIFLTGSDEEAVRAYLNGLRGDLPKLARLGLRKDEIASVFSLFDRVEDEAIKSFLYEADSL